MAIEAERTAHEDPANADSVALQVLAATSDPRAVISALRARGIAARAHSDLDDAEARFSEAVDAADDAGLAEEAAFSCVLLSSVYALTGRHAEAVGALERATSELSGERRVLATIQLGAVRNTAGDFKGGLEALDSVKEDLDGLTPQRLSVFLLNRGDSLLHTHRPREAAQAFERVVELRLDSGDSHQILNALHHLAEAYVTAGMTAEALTCFRRIDDLDLGPTDGTSWVDRASVLLAAGLLTEAEHAARQARQAAVEDPQSYWVSLAPMVHAETLEAMGDLAEAASAADDAARLFGAQGHAHLTDRATAIALRCRARLGDADLASMSEVAHRLTDSGNALESSALRLAIARSASDTVARPHLEQVSNLPVEGVADLVASAEASARIALIDGNRAAAIRIIDGAFRDLGAWRSALGSTELQATTARLAVPLADLALGEALERDDAMAVLRAAERMRLSSVVSSTSPVDDPDIERLLAQLRSAKTDRAQLAEEAADVHRSAIEAEIRELSRLRMGTAVDARDFSLDRVIDGLDGHVLVEFVDHAGQMHAVVVEASPRLVALGSGSELAAEVDSLRFAMERLSSPVGSPASREAFRGVMAAAVGNIDRMLMEPLSIGADAPIVLVPSSPVAAVPWAALPSLGTRSFSVAPSAQLRADLARLPGGRGAVAVGVDDPATARSEARAVAGLIGGRSLLGSAATVESVLRAIDGVDVAHLACHGRFRFDNPLMSSVEMSDGPLTVYDIERLSDAPRTVVMSACEVGQTARTSGEGLLGMAASLMAAGTRNVIASGTTVSDEATETFMVEFHRARLDGLSAASALRAARAATAHEPDVSLVGASFVCLGL